MLLAGAPWRSFCWPGRRGTAASRSAAAELLAGSAMAKRMAALWQRAIGKSCWQGRLGRVAGRGCRGREWKAGTATSTGKASNLPEGMHHREDAAGRGAAAKSHREASKERALLQAGKEHPVLGKQKRERQNPLSLKPALVMPLSRVLQELARGGLHNCYCALWNFYGDAAAVAHLVWLLFGYGDRFYGNKGILHSVKIINI